MRKTVLTLILALVCPGVTLAQGDSSGTGTISGVVYDSIAHAPIAGAHVQAVPASSPAQRVHAATTDAKGRYAIESLPPGRYLVGFESDVLDTLALSEPLYTVEVRAGERSKADLAVPSGATIVAKACGGSSVSDSTGLLIGILRDARSLQALDTGYVEARWQEITIEPNGRLGGSQRSAIGVVGRDGWFAMCGVPVSAEVGVRAIRLPDSSGMIGVTLPEDGFARRDLFLGGAGTIRGRVITERDKPLANARVTVAGSERVGVTDAAGAFRLADIPAGSQTLAVRALGYAQVLLPVTLAAGADTSVTFRMTELKRVMDTIRVVAQRIYNRDSYGFLQRKRTGQGYYVDADRIARERPLDVSQLLFRVPALHVRQQGFRRTWVMRGGSGGGYCQPLLYINGMRMPPEVLADLDFMARPEEVEGIEVYRSTATPPQFADYQSQCGAIVVWTRPPRRASRKEE